jgi:hypothetical protein
MKIPSLKLESKVLLTAVAVCIFGVLRMANIVHMSDRDDAGVLFLIGFVLAVSVLSKDHDSPATNAVYFLSFGLIFWNLLTPSHSMIDVLVKWPLLVLTGISCVSATVSTIKGFRKGKQKEVPDSQAEN